MMLRLGLSVLSRATSLRISRNSKPSRDKERSAIVPVILEYGVHIWISHWFNSWAISSHPPCAGVDGRCSGVWTELCQLQPLTQALIPGFRLLAKALASSFLSLAHLFYSLCLSVSTSVHLFSSNTKAENHLDHPPQQRQQCVLRQCHPPASAKEVHESILNIYALK